MSKRQLRPMSTPARVVDDQLGLDPDEAVVVAAGRLGGVGET